MFIRTVGEKLSCKRISDSSIVKSDRVQHLLDMLDTLYQWAEETEPLPQDQRYGNKAFRTWHQKLVSVSQLFFTNYLITIMISEALTF